MRLKYKSLLCLVLCLVTVLSSAVGVGAAGAEDKVLLGGMAFGVSFCSGQLKISGFDDVEVEGGTCSPARDAGLIENDIICSVNEKAVKCAADITLLLKSSGGEQLDFKVLREGKEKSFKVAPVRSVKSGEWRVGLWLSDSTAGLGTVTYIDGKTGEFAGLGHGIVDSDTGELCDMSRGIVSKVIINKVNKGKKGEPGELCGDFLPIKLGVVTKNTDCGVFGVLTDTGDGQEKREIEIARAEEIKDGGAVIYSTVDSEGICEYAVEISRLENSPGENRNFLITVTDTALLEKTGGIVRGMSGSPIIQDGKLVGAVTHVLVNDPTRGYGIFIENMLDVAG